MSKRYSYDDCVSDEALDQLKYYRYSGVDKSPIARYILTPYWNYVTTLLPLWLAPNLITLLGLVAILINIVSIEILVPDFIGPGPTWMYWSFVIGLWIYSTLDNVDGKQARRTVHRHSGNSSIMVSLRQLGLIIGIDSLNCPLAGLTMTAACGYGSTPLGLFTVLIPCAPMFVSSWEQYHTGVLYLGYFNGPCEGIIIACTLMGIAAVYGPGFYHQRAVDVVGWPITDDSITISDLFVGMCVSALFFVHLPSWFTITYKFTHVQFVQCLQGSKGSRAVISGNVTTIAARHLILCGALCVATQSILTNTQERTSDARRANNDPCIRPYDHQNHPRISPPTTLLIQAHLTRQPFPYFTSLIIPLALIAIVINLPFLGIAPILTPEAESSYLWGYLGLATVVYFRWAFVVIDRICEFLDINCLTIKSKAMKN